MSGKKVGLIGVGRMGVGLGKNLLENGFQVSAFDTTASNIDPLDEFGVVRAASLLDVLEGAEFVITCLPSVPSVEAVYDGEQGLIANAAPQTILIDCTSNNPVLTRELGEKAKPRNVHMVDAPILRGMKQAWDGTIQLVVGGDADVVEKCKEVFDAICEDTIYVGPLGNAHTVKALNNQVTLSNHVAVCESFSIARKMGIDLEMLHQVLDASQASSKKLNDLAPRLIQGNHEITIAIDAAAKDSRNFLSLAHALGAQVDVAQATYNLFQEASDKGLGNEAPTRLATILEEKLGL